MLTKYGIKTHIVHYVYDYDLKIMEEEMKETNNKDQINVTPQFYASEL